MPGKDSHLDTSAFGRVVALVGLIIIFGAGWFWWHNIYMSPQNVFWGMISNNLSSASVTRRVQQTAADRSVDQYIRMQFGPVSATESLITITQTDSTGKNVVKTSTIGTPLADYSKYVSIATPKKSSDGKSIDASSVLGIWGRGPAATSVKNSSAQYFKQSILTILPFGYFDQKQKQEIIGHMRDHEIYDVTFSNAKTERQNGRSVFIYDVEISPAAYVQMMKLYVKYLGLGDIGLNPSAYAGSPDLKAQITIDKISRQLVKISYPDTKQSETIVDHNLDQPVIVPEKTIPVAELQQRLQKAVQ